MAYKKYIKRGGKLYGPYIYHSKRVDGKVVSEYRGQKKFDYNKFILIFFGVMVFLVLIYLFSMLDFRFTGKAVLDLNANYIEGDLLEGNIKLLLDDEERIPTSSKLIIENNGENVFEEDLEKLIYPDIYFTLLILSTEQNDGSLDDNEGKENNENEKTNAGFENDVNKVYGEGANEGSDELENFDGIIEGNTEETGEVDSTGIFNFFLGLGMTGNVVVEYEKEIQGVVSKEGAFNYELNDGQRVEIKPKSVKTSARQLKNNDVFLEVNGNRVVVTTEYSVKEVNLNLSEFNLYLKPGILKIMIVDGDKEIVSLTRDIEEESILKETIPKSSIVEQTIQDQHDLDNEVIVKENTFEPIESTFELSRSEKDLLIYQFGTIPNDPEEVLLRNDFIIVRYELAGYWVEYSYPADLNKEALEFYMERDKNKWLKDIVISLSQEKKEERIDFNKFFN